MSASQCRSHFCQSLIPLDDALIEFDCRQNLSLLSLICTMCVLADENRISTMRSTLAARTKVHGMLVEFN